ITPEMELLSDIVPQPFMEWKIGKEFYVTDDKITLALNPSYKPVEQLGGKIVRYAGMRTIPDVTGSESTEILLTTPDNTEVVYRVNASPADLAARSSVEIPFTIEMDLVNATSKRLTGMKAWVLTPVWYDMDDKASTGRKFVPVTIDEIMPGNLAYPVKLTFTDEAGQKHRLFMSLGNERRATRPFASLFAFTNPKDRYPNTPDETWQNIIDGKVAKYMTRDECRLALGSPNDVDKGANYSSVIEKWTYDNGVYLIFEDGLLVRFRK
ncbi:MAG: hypothetical protein K2M65_02445, partial [Muribaculaceae bacterium]|nr:hypothetical protein [Muribaculaceae bacterium]